MSNKEECYFCHGGDRLIHNALKAIEDQIKNPVDLTNHRCCEVCIKILCSKAVALVTADMIDEKEPKIKICKCGKQPIIDQYDLNDFTSPYFVECPCGKTSEEFDCISDAVEDWNKA